MFEKLKVSLAAQDASILKLQTEIKQTVRGNDIDGCVQYGLQSLFLTICLEKQQIAQKMLEKNFYCEIFKKLIKLVNKTKIQKIH